MAAPSRMKKLVCNHFADVMQTCLNTKVEITV